MLYSEFEELCRKTWSEKSNYMFTDMTRNRIDGKYRIFKENKNTFSDFVSKIEAF